jgi:Uncharacterized protein conserved in bacteria (DUF2242)
MIKSEDMQNLDRRSLFRLALPIPAAGVLALLSACSSSHPPLTPQQQFFDSSTNSFSRTFDASSTEACESARRALLSQGYLATATHPDTIDATRDFQPSSDKHITVEFHVVCTPGDDPENTTIVYANAVQSGYALKKSDTSASVGFSVLGSVSLPIRSNSDSMVKVSSVTIESKSFYQQFFEYVASYLHKPAKRTPVPPAAIKAMQAHGGPAAPATPPATAAAPETGTPQQTAAPTATTITTPTSTQPPATFANAPATAPALSTLSAPPPAAPAAPAAPAKSPQGVEPTPGNAPAVAPAATPQ